MNNNDKDLEAALDDIFGSDFIEIDVSQSKKDEELSNNINELDMVQPEDDKLIAYSEQIQMPESSTFKENEKATNDLNDEISKTQDNIDFYQSANEEKFNSDEESVEKKIKNKKMIIWIIIYFILILLAIFILVNYVFGVTKVVNCSSSAEDLGYKYTDEYKITYKKNSINFIENTYTYTALTDEFKSQIELIKQDKLLYIVNSNGMPGFTYLYETCDNHIKIDGYFDFGLIEFDKVDKLDQEKMPIFPIKIDSKTTFKVLKNSLENEGYKCIPSK